MMLHQQLLQTWLNLFHPWFLCDASAELPEDSHTFHLQYKIPISKVCRLLMKKHKNHCI